MTNNSLIRTWEDCYSVSLGNVRLYKKRLKELSSWDKPLGTPSTNKNGNWTEWACKKIALEGLILEKTI